MENMATGKFDIKDTPTAIALIAADVEVVKGTTKDIKEQLSNFIEKCDGKFTNFSERLACEETATENFEKDMEILGKKIDKMPSMFSYEMSNHVKGCPSREATMQRLVRPSRPPKDTPKEIKQPLIINGNGSAIVPKWLVWIAASVGIGIAVFVFLYIKMAQNFGN